MIRLDTVDSTNNYAMRLIDAASAGHGDVILAAEQSLGKGQRGKSWYHTPGESLMLSLIIAPNMPLSAQPVFLAAAAVAIADVINGHLPFSKTAIKWPNDILIRDKKAVGILIENVVHGSEWQWAIIGIGVNVGQQAFPDNLPNATSLQMQTEQIPSLSTLAAEIADAVVDACAAITEENAPCILAAYNDRLYQRNQLQAFRWGYDMIVRRVLGVEAGGR